MARLLLGRRRRGQLGPDALPIITHVLAPNGTVRREFQTDAILGCWNAPFVANSPLSNLGVALDVVAKLDHARPQLRNAGSAGG